MIQISYIRNYLRSLQLKVSNLIHQVANSNKDKYLFSWYHILILKRVWNFHALNFNHYLVSHLHHKPWPWKSLQQKFCVFLLIRKKISALAQDHQQQKHKITYKSVSKCQTSRNALNLNSGWKCIWSNVLQNLSLIWVSCKHSCVITSIIFISHFLSWN